MTFVKRSRRDMMVSRLLAVGIIPLIAGVVVVVILYSRSVSIHDDFSKSQEALKRLESQNAELREAILGMFDGNNVRTFAAERGLIQELHPSYFELHQPWELASQY